MLRGSSLPRWVLTLTISAALLAPALGAAEASEPVRPTSVWTVFTTVEVLVRDDYAVVKVIADIRNQGPDPEFPFVVRVPAEAFVTGLTIERDGVVHEARIEDRDAAREEYDAHKAKEQTGGLVEKRRGTSVYSYLVNVAEFTNVVATLTYETYLAPEEGERVLRLEAPVSGFGEDRGARFDVTVRHSDGVLALYGQDGATARREGDALRLVREFPPRGKEDATPYEVRYQLPPTGEAGSLVATVVDGRGTFVHRLRAPEESRTIPVDLCLALDVSGSMSGAKMSQMQDAAAQVVRVLGEEDRLHVAFFSSDVHSVWRGLREATAENRQLAAREIGGSIAAGGTNIGEALRACHAALGSVERDDGRLPVLVLLTDGMPTNGVTDRSALVRIATEDNAAGASVFALAFGGDADWGLVHVLASEGGGAALRVPEGEGAEVDLRRFMAALAAPVLRDVRVDYADAVEARMRTAPVLLSGGEVLVVGSFDPSLQRLAGEVVGRTSEEERRAPFDTPVEGGAPWLARLAAWHEIRRLQDLVDAEGERAEWVEAIKTLALRHGFVTDYTSLVVTLDPRDAREPGVGREVQPMMLQDTSTTGGWTMGSADSASSAPRTRGAGGGSSNLAYDASEDDGPRAEPAATPAAGVLAALAAIGALALAVRRRRT